MSSDFAKDVAEGLAQKPKKLSSRFFYDRAGDELFVKIMNMPEYYLTDCEFEIFNEQKKEIVTSLNMNGDIFNLFELGAGDGTKTIELLKVLNNSRFKYIPIDISHNAIDKLEQKLKAELPEVAVQGVKGEYFETLGRINGEKPKVILFLGSNIGNMTDLQSSNFLKKLSNAMNTGDKLLVGFDLKKSIDIVLPAYNDKQGYTKAFNLNLLKRINCELEADFDLGKFDHKPEYNEEEGIAKSFIESKQDQVVTIGINGQKIKFNSGERIQTEISKKYNINDIKLLINDIDLNIRDVFYDKRKYFCDVMFEKI